MDNGVPFHVAAPLSTVDWAIADGVRDIPIEERGGEEVTHVAGVRVAARGSAAANFGFDVTPARLITSIVTEAGAVSADEESLATLR